MERPRRANDLKKHMAFNHSPKIVTDGLVLHLDAASPKSYVSGGTVWTDLSRSGNNGTLTNGPTFNAANGGSIVFDGVNDYVDINSFIFNQSSVFSVSFWIKILNNSSQQYLIDLRNSDVAGDASLIAYNQNGIGGKIHYTVFGDSSTWPSTSTTLIPLLWYNVTTIHNSLINNIKIYINSILDLNSNFSTDLTTSSSPLRIGARRFTNTNPLQGNISQLLIYNKALSSSEILQNYKATKARFNL